MHNFFQSKWQETHYFGILVLSFQNFFKLGPKLKLKGVKNKILHPNLMVLPISRTVPSQPCFWFNSFLKFLIFVLSFLHMELHNNLHLNLLVYRPTHTYYQRTRIFWKNWERFCHAISQNLESLANLMYHYLKPAHLKRKFVQILYHEKNS